MAASLPTITTLARAGALARAESLFAEGGYASRTDDPAALAVKGRLIKDRALISKGPIRMGLFREAGVAYAAADALSPAPYLLINVATLAMLAGDQARAAEVAEVVLERIATGGVAETPYWLAATRAEALLLKDDLRAANAALTEAIGHDPDGWTDHASTLRQLGLIVDAKGLAKDWLDPHRPPKSLHFAGHLGVMAQDCAALRAHVDAFIAAERIGFGFGALAVGADIVVAEALLGSGAEVHVVLPTPRHVFVEQSVKPYGEDWVSRFETCIDKAASVREATQTAGDYEPLATALAADTAMGGALLNARALESSALQLLVIDEGDGPYGNGAHTGRDGKAWAKAGHCQTMIRIARGTAISASAWKQEGRADRKLRALLHLSFEGLDGLDDHAFELVLDTVLRPFAVSLAGISGQPEHAESWGNARLLAFADVGAAARFALAVQQLEAPGAMAPIIAGHYGLVHDIGGNLTGPGVCALIDLQQAAIPARVTVTEAFATALAIASGAAVRTEFVGDRVLAGLRGGTRLFTLSES